MPDKSSEQKFFWLVAVVLAGGLLAGAIYPRYHEVVVFRREIRELRGKKEAEKKKVVQLREAIAALKAGDEAAWERAVRSRLRYHPKGTTVFTDEGKEPR